MMVYWNEYSEEYGHTVESIDEREAIAIAKHWAAMRGYFYDNDQTALDDFMVIHWAWIEGGRP